MENKQPAKQPDKNVWPGSHGPEEKAVLGIAVCTLGHLLHLHKLLLHEVVEGLACLVFGKHCLAGDDLLLGIFVLEQIPEDAKPELAELVLHDVVDLSREREQWHWHWH